ncbi:efflux transporter outer membrane subunit [Aquitalea denitrificans]|uniref:efflux transporter outer membrane subunit n=1 Tax=Aquitalea denitrificans TaxID=519081 RepID=UPI00135C35E7|nr:efflux transporter outer membrane subunit [Aquitalea denitrificans]
MSHRILFPLLFPLLALTACAVGPDYHAPQTTLPAHYQHQAGSSQPQLQRWWTVFDDAALSQLVEQALQSSPDLAQADARVRQARASLGVVDSALWPQLNAGVRSGRDQFSRNSENFANIPFANPRTGFNDQRLQLDASWEIDLFGHTARSREAAAARLDSVQEQQADVALRVAAEVARNVIDYRGWVARQHNLEAQLAAARESLRLTGLLRQTGEISDSELNQAASNVASLQAALPALHTAQGATVAALSVLLDQTQAQLLATLAAERPVPATLAQAPVGMPADLLRRRADIRQAERELAAATADIGVAVAEQYPRLVLVGSGGWDSIHEGNLTAAASRFWNVGPQLSLPLFTGGRLKNQVTAREAARDAALAAYRQKVLAALADTETALLRYQQEAQRQHALQANVELAELQLGLARQRFRVGEVAKTEVLAQQQLEAQQREAWLASRQAQAENLVALFKALGGGMQGK